MIDFDQQQRRLRLPPDQLETLARLATGQEHVELSDDWLEAGLVADGAVHPVAAAMAVTAVAPDRAIAVERLAGASIAPLMIGWSRSGRMTMTEHVPADDADGHLVITATHFELLPALFLQAVGLQPDQPAAAGDRIDTTAGVIDDAIADITRCGVFGSLAAPDELMAALKQGEIVLRATGSWSGQPADISVTLLLAGVAGVWIVEHEDHPAPSRDTAVRLLPTDVVTATARLGDVVTGRRSRQRAAA